MDIPVKDFAQYVLAMPRTAKRGLVLCVDVCLCVLAAWLAFFLRLGTFIALRDSALFAALASIVFALPVFVSSGLYAAIFRYSSRQALMTVFKATLVYGLLYATVFVAIGVPNVPRTVGLIQPILLLIMVGASRAFARFWLGGLYHVHLRMSSLPRVLIYGAGAAGRQMAAATANSTEMRVVGYLDDDDRLHGHVLDSLPIYRPADLPVLAQTMRVSMVVLAIPSTFRKRRNEILEALQCARVSVRTLPDTTEAVRADDLGADVRELDIIDLLGREPVTPNSLLMRRSIAGKCVLVTGAGGAIGTELCRQILLVRPHALLLVEQSELALDRLYRSLTAQLARDTTVRLVPLLASVVDADRMRDIMTTWSPDTVYHAAAHNHAPLIEYNLVEGIKNNVMGTLVTAQAAAAANVATFVLASTDKAVRPDSVLGASKRLAERVLQAMAPDAPQTCFAAVRLGNVNDAANALVQTFRQQIAQGGPVKLEHADTARHFMTLPEAAQLLIQAGAMARSGDIYALDMGAPQKIRELAVRMVRLSGLSVRDVGHPEGDIEIRVTGPDAGEAPVREPRAALRQTPTSMRHIARVTEDFMDWPTLSAKLDALAMVLGAGDVGIARQLLRQLVPDYEPDGDIVDLLYLAQDAEADALDGTPSGRG
ncbi:polysaccharide biosynthesis protein [Pandoraea sp. NPDC087047]|uniref:polysaccharide biosynthesis protein n=1 Tax=Pandoraea sp. NPDC087047 TaxID=3364390 RepID=UPI0037FD1DC4